MKQRFLFLMMTVLLSVGAWAADDLTLNPAETVAFGDWGFDNSAAPTLNFGNYAAGGGWQFDTALSQDDYCGVDFAFNATTETHVTFMICYEGGAEQDIDVPTGSTGIKADFAYTGGITKIGFKYGDWEATVNENGASITITKAVVKANSTGEVVELAFADLNDDTKDEVNKAITLQRYNSAPSWTFNPALSSGDYEKLVVTFAEAIPEEGLTITLNGETFAGLVSGATKATAYFTSGVSIASIGFYYGWNSKQGDTDEAPTATLKIAKVELVKKASSASDEPTETPDTDGNYTITINESDNGSVTADHTNANEGETITLTVTPASDSYKMVKLTIEQTTDDEGDGTPVLYAPRRTPGFASNVEYTKVDDTHYTFVMPANDVEISAVFSDNPVARPTITYDAPNNKVTLSLTKQPTGEDAGFASNAKIYYTTDGTDPTTSATKQESETDVDITVTKDITIIKAVGVSSTGNFSVEVSQEVSLVRYLTVSKEWTVFCSPETFSVPEGLKAYTISAVTQPDNDGEAGSVTLKEQTLIAEGVPMVIQNTQIESSTEKFQIQEAEGEIAGADMCANFKGSATAASTLSSSNRNYVLKNGEFIRTTATKVSQYNCYLEFSTASASPAPRYSITIDGNTTSVKTIGVATLDEGDWYTLGGVHMQQPNQKGVYIHGGKKVVIK